MAILRRAILASALVGTGLAATTGAALADEDSAPDQSGLVNVGDVQTIAPLNVCNNDVPVNALGVQIPIQDVAADIPLLSPSEGHHSGNSGSVAKSCGSGVDAAN